MVQLCSAECRMPNIEKGSLAPLLLLKSAVTTVSSYDSQQLRKPLLQLAGHASWQQVSAT